MTPSNGIGARTGRRRDWSAAWEKVEREQTCRVCTAPATDPAHLVHRSVGGTMDPDLIAPLCRAHHQAFDGGDLDLLPYLRLDEQAAAVRVAGLHRAYLRLTGTRPSELEAARLGEAAA